MTAMYTEVIGKMMRCRCGARVWLTREDSCCPQCGLTPSEIVERRKRRCLLIGCGQEFMPKHSQQRTCCDEHARLYENQENRRRHAQKLGKIPGGPRKPCAPSFSIGLGPASPPPCTHVCAGYPGHKCDVRTPNRRCPECTQVWLSLNGVHLNAAQTCAMDECPS